MRDAREGWSLEEEEKGKGKVKGKGMLEEDGREEFAGRDRGGRKGWLD